MRDAPDHSPTLNIITHFQVTDLFFQHCVIHCDVQAEQMDDGRLPRNQALTFQREISWDMHPLPFTFQRPKTAQEVHGCLVGSVIKKG